MRIRRQDILEARKAFVESQITAHQGWLHGCSGPSARMIDPNLNASWLDLSSMLLSKAVLKGAMFRWAKLTAAHFDDANLRSSSFEGVEANLTNFRGADLSGAGMRGADLRDAIFTEAVCSLASFTGADLLRARCSRANFHGANFEGACLSYADLSYAELVGTNLTGANLHGAIVTGTCLDPANKLNYSASFRPDPERFAHVLGYRTRDTKHIQRYQDGLYYSADWFSTAETECHPGLYIWPTYSKARDWKGSGHEIICVSTRPEVIHQAGLKWRCKWFYVIGNADPS